MQIAKNAVATIHYTLRNDDGDVLDTSEGSEPLPYLHGSGNLIPGLEAELEGKGIGDELQVRIEAKDAYGERDPRMVHVVKREQLPAGEIVVGMQFHAESSEGTAVVTVSDVAGDDITLDANHPLAGVALNFAVEIVGVREATTEELEHGHIHGPGGVEH